MKQQVDKHKHWSEISFNIGDQVFVKIQPYVQSSQACRSNQKLAFNFLGSYTIVDKIGSVAYRLDLPTSSNIHPVFHVSQLKRVVSPTNVVSSELPDDSVPYQVPQEILATRLAKKGDTEVAQVLVRWSNMCKELATGETRNHCINSSLELLGVKQALAKVGRVT
jgi:hypothetical protein